MTLAIDLERKTELALAARFQQSADLAKVRFRANAEDSAKVNQDIVISAKRGEGNPPFSGIYNLTATLELSMKHRKTVDTLPAFLTFCKAVEDVLAVPTYTLAKQVTACQQAFHCYEIAVTDKDNTPKDNRHNCIWTFSIIAMAQDYAIAALTEPTKT